MLLNSITLENIRSYKKESIDFPRGITLFEGDIGSGKSTVLMGIEFALFGLGSIKGDGLLSRKAKEGSVKLNFEVDNIQYEIVRKIIKKGKTISQDSKNCFLIEDGVEEPLAPTELKQRILQILKFNEPSESRSESRIYRYAVFMPQDEMKYVLLYAEKRWETIRKAFNLEKYQIAVENASDLTRGLDKDLARFKAKFEDLGQSVEKKKEIMMDIKNRSRNIIDLKKERKEITEKQIIIEKQYSKLQEKKSNKDKQTMQLENIQDGISKENDRLELLNVDLEDDNLELQGISKEILKLKQIKKPTEKSLGNINKEIKKYRDLEKKIIDTKSRHASELKNIDELSNGLDDFLKSPTSSLEKKMKILKTNMKNYDEKIEKVEQEMKEQETLEIQNKSRLNEIQEKLSNLDGVNTKCPICETTLSAKHIKDLEKKHQSKIIEINNDLKNITNKISKLSSLIKDTKSNMKKDEDSLNEIENVLPLLNKIKTKTDQLKKTGTELQELKNQNIISEEKNFPNKEKLDIVSYLNALKDELGNFTTISKQIKGLTINEEKMGKRIKKSLENKEKLSVNIKSLKKNHKEIIQQINKFQTLDQEIFKVESEKKKINDKVIGLEKSLSEENANLNNLKQDLEEIILNISNSNLSKENYEKYSRYQEWIQHFFISAVKQIETQVMLDIQRRFNETYQNWYSMLIEDPSKESRIDEDFTPVLFQDGYSQDLKNLSGGEKTSIALAYRLTLNSMIRQETDSLKSNLLILDEPTDGFSSSQLTKIRTVLQELHSQQIIIVSHEKELETYVDNIFHVRKDDGISKVTRLNN
jgi:DNA repair protein SbcC/Rad50